MASRLLKPFVRREIKARQDRVGTVMSDMTLREYNTGASPVWVCDVDIGSNRLMRDVPIKANASGSRFYAQRGQSVLLRRNTQGRYDVVAAADRLAATGNIKTYELGNPTPITDNPQGFVTIVDPFEYYQGPTPGTPGTSRWNDGTTPFPSVRVVSA